MLFGAYQSVYDAQILKNSKYTRITYAATLGN
jgi:hypothetical protein